MGRQLNYQCDQHSDLRDCADVVVLYFPHFDEFGLPIRDGGASSLAMHYCPWCGTKLPPSKRDLWFDTLESLGVDSPLTDDIPAEYRTDAWWRNLDAPVA
ncbi:MAG: hypothetical protein Aurels2KO_57650 [Aureliella sp.]